MTHSAHLVVTGTYRSGTTLVERLVDNSRDAYCAPQPFPFLYLAAKRRFLEQTGRAVPEYPIGSGFHDPAHQPDELATYLQSAVMDRGTIRDAFQSMHGYSGAQTPELADVVDRVPEGTLTDVVRAMHTLLAQSLRPAATLLASKEILVEEFIPSFAAAGIATLIVIRDPRRVAASTFGPGASRWTGPARPLLYTIRLWRKSVAYALGSGPPVAVVRMEDCVADGTAALQAGLRAVGIESDATAREPLLDAHGGVWQPNTSFADRDQTAAALSERQLAYVEALALPEMLLLGYEPVTDGDLDTALDGFRPDDDPGRDHPAFVADFSVDAAQLTLERERLAHLRSDEPLPDEDSWFVLPQVRGRLAAARRGVAT